MKEKNIDETRKLGERIKIIRTTLGLTQNQFSEVADISINFLSDIENGKKKPSIETLVKICVGFNLSADYILFGVDYNQHTALELSKYIYELSDDDLQTFIEYTNSLKKIREQSE